MKAKFVGAVGLVVTSMSAIHAQVYQQSPIGVDIGGFRADGTSGTTVRARFADNFRLNANATVNRIQWWGGGEASPDQFRVILFADAAGVPGAPIVQFAAGNGSPQPTAEWTDQGRGIQRMLYSATIPAVELPGQQQLWLNIENTTDATWAWSFAAAEPFGILRSYDGGPWGDPYGNNASFALFAVPEPISAALMAFASVALFLRRRRD